MIAALLGGLAAGFGIAISIGPVGILLANLGARGPMRVAVVAGLGVATVDGLYALVAAVGGGAMTNLLTPIATPLRLVSRAALFGLAARTAFGSIRDSRASSGECAVPSTGPDRGLPAYFGFVGLTLLNPTTVSYFAALVLSRHEDYGRFGPAPTAFVVAAFVASACCQLLFVSGGAVVGRFLTSRSGRLVTGLLSSAVITALAVVSLID